jgi:hypothetical protein
MVTPAVLIAVCASLTMGTSNRLNRVIERTRKLFEQYKAFVAAHQEKTIDGKQDIEQMMLNRVIDLQTRRVKYLQKSLTSIYLAITFFILTCIAIGIIQIGKFDSAWIALTIGMLGAFLMFYSSILLILETNIALEAVNIEMEFVRRLVFSPDKEFTLSQRNFLRRLWIKG